MYSVVLFGFIVHIKYFKLRIFSLYVDLKLIYFVFGDFDWIFVEAIVMRMTMGDRMVYPPDTLNRFIPSGGINSYIPRIVLGRILYFVIPASNQEIYNVNTQVAKGSEAIKASYAFVQHSRVSISYGV